MNTFLFLVQSMLAEKGYHAEFSALFGGKDKENHLLGQIEKVEWMSTTSTDDILRTLQQLVKDTITKMELGDEENGITIKAPHAASFRDMKGMVGIIIMMFLDEGIRADIGIVGKTDNNRYRLVEDGNWENDNIYLDIIYKRM